MPRPSSPANPSSSTAGSSLASPPGCTWTTCTGTLPMRRATSIPKLTAVPRPARPVRTRRRRSRGHRPCRQPRAPRRPPRHRPHGDRRTGRAAVLVQRVQRHPLRGHATDDHPRHHLCRRGDRRPRDLGAQLTHALLPLGSSASSTNNANRPTPWSPPNANRWTGSANTSIADAPAHSLRWGGRTPTEGRYRRRLPARSSKATPSKCPRSVQLRVVEYWHSAHVAW